MSELPVWDKEPMLHILWINYPDEISHQVTFQKGFIAAMRICNATTKKAEKAWSKQAEEIFDIYMRETEKVNSAKEAE